MTPGAVRPLLRVLRQAHLVQHVDGRWRLHDLIRLHVSHIPIDDDTMAELAAARGRLFDHYLRLSTAANDHMQALSGQSVSNLFAGRDVALVWLDCERANLIAAVEHAANTRDHPVAIGLSSVLAGFLDWRRHFSDWVIVADHAASAARQLADPRHEAATATNLGLALREVGRLDEAIASHQHAVALHQRAGDRYLEGSALTNLGNALRATERFDEAIAAHQQALAIFQESGDRHREGMAWNNLGLALKRANRFDEAITAYEQDIAICQEMADHHGEGLTWHNLAVAYREVERFEDAIKAHHNSRALYRDTGDHFREGRALEGLGFAMRDAGRSEEARACWLEAVEAFTASDAPDDAARVRELLGSL